MTTSQRPGTVLASLLVAVLAFVALQVLLYTPLQAYRLMFGNERAGAWVFAVVVLLAILGIFLVVKQRLGAAVEHASRMMAAVSAGRWIATTVVVGLLLRILWMSLFPAQASSDEAVYLQLAQRLAQGQRYEIAGTLAYWPPGFPLILSGLLGAGFDARATVLVLNLALFAGHCWLAWVLALRFGGPLAARWVLGLFALWPAFVAGFNLPSKEAVLMFVLTLAAWIYVRVTDAALSQRWLVVCGLCLGLAALVQPSSLLFPSVLIGIHLVMRGDLRALVGRLVIVGLFTVAVIAPWTYRNLEVFGRFVPISTNGGSNFYRANNPLATGGYTDRGAIDFSGFDELEANRQGFRHGLDWIAANPTAFLALSAHKQTLFLGDNAGGVYASLKRGGLEVGNAFYGAMKLAANAFWMALWLAILAACGRARRDGAAALQATAVLALPFMYLYALHSIFESGSRYPLPALLFVGVLAARGLSAGSPQTR